MRQTVAAGWAAQSRTMTIAEAAARGSWAPQLWHDWENGRRIPTRANMIAVCEITGLEPNDFYPVGGVPFCEWRRRLLP